MPHCAGAMPKTAQWLPDAGTVIAAPADQRKEALQVVIDVLRSGFLDDVKPKSPSIDLAIYTLLRTKSLQRLLESFFKLPKADSTHFVAVKPPTAKGGMCIADENGAVSSRCAMT
jgi:hypothetical protein